MAINNLGIFNSQLNLTLQFSSVQFSHSEMSNSLRPHESQHARPPCPSPTPGVYSNSCPSSWWCHPTECLMNYGRGFVTLYRRQVSRPSPWKRNAKMQNGCLRSRVPGQPWTEVHDILQETGIRPSPWKRNAKSKMAVWGGLTNSYEKKRSEKQRRKGKIFPSECRVPKNSKET